MDRHPELLETILRCVGGSARCGRHGLHIAKALQDQTEYQPWVRHARPIIEPLDSGRFGVRMRKEGRVMVRQWPAPWPTFESIAERLLLMREHDRHIKPRSTR